MITAESTLCQVHHTIILILKLQYFRIKVTSTSIIALYRYVSINVESGITMTITCARQFIRTSTFSIM